MVIGRVNAAKSCNRAITALAAVITGLFLTSGCAVNPASSSSTKYETVAERDMLADAARDVKAAPWPKPEPVSFVSRITGADSSKRITKNDAAQIYASLLRPEGARFSRLEADVEINLLAANRLLNAADIALAAPRLTANDVAFVEDSIQALRENRQIFVNAARYIQKSGEAVDDDRLDAIRDAYSSVIRDIGEAADALADRLDHDQSENYASPAARPRINNFSGV